MAAARASLAESYENSREVAELLLLGAHDVAVGQHGWAAEVPKANAVDLFKAVRVDKDADVSKALKEVQLVCRHAPERANNMDSVLLVKHHHILSLLWLLDRIA